MTIHWEWDETGRSEREVDNIGDCWNKYGWTFFEKPGGDGIWIRLLVCTVGQDLVYFGFWGRSENWEISRSSRSWGWVRRLCSRVAGERKAEFGYFAFEKKKQSCLQVKCQKKWWVAVRKTLVEMYNYWTADTQFVTMTTSVAYTKLKIIIGINAWSQQRSVWHAFVLSTVPVFSAIDRLPGDHSHWFAVDRWNTDVTVSCNISRDLPVRPLLGDISRYRYRHPASVGAS